MKTNKSTASIGEVEPPKTDILNVENEINKNDLIEIEEKKEEEIPVIVGEEEKKNEEDNVLKSGNNEGNEEIKNQEVEEEKKEENNGSQFVGEEFAYMEDEEVDVKNIG